MLVGHTHEDIGRFKNSKNKLKLLKIDVMFSRFFHNRPGADGIFSLITSCLNSEGTIQTPRDIQRTDIFGYSKLLLSYTLDRVILQKLSGVFERKGLVLEVHLVDTASWINFENLSNFLCNS